MAYTKLFPELIHSTIWRAPDTTRILWITMLAMRDQRHEVRASIPGLADAARITLEACESGLTELMSPDPYSRTKDFGGRRIEVVDGGWRILNGEKFKARMSEEERKTYQAEWIRRKRALAVDAVDMSTKVDRVDTVEQSRVEKSRSKKKDKSVVRSAVALGPDFVFSIPDEILTNWKKAYPSVDIDAQVKRAASWAQANPAKRKKNWTAFLVRWLAKEQERGPRNWGFQTNKPVSAGPAFPSGPMEG